MTALTINANGIINHPRVIQQTRSHGYNTRAERTLAAIGKITFHQSVSPSIRTIEQINAWWTAPGRAWNRPGYAIAIQGNGEIWQLAPLRIPTWGAGPAGNPQSLHIVFLGTFSTNALPSSAQQASAGWLVSQLLANKSLPNVTNLNQHVVGHNFFAATACPGAPISKIRQWITSAGKNPPAINSGGTNNPAGWNHGTHNVRVRVTSDTLNVRQARNATSKIVRTLRRGDTFTVGFVAGINNANPVDTPWGNVDGVAGNFVNLNHVERVDNVVTVGVQVIVSGTATTWATGQNLPVWVRGQRYNVIQMRNNDTEALLEGINSWIRVSDVSVV